MIHLIRAIAIAIIVAFSQAVARWLVPSGEADIATMLAAGFAWVTAECWLRMIYRIERGSR